MSHLNHDTTPGGRSARERARALLALVRRGLQRLSDRTDWYWGLGVVAAFALAGVLSGVIWNWVTTPTSVVVYRGEVGWSSTSVKTAFDPVGTYVVISLAAGVLCGAVVGGFVRRRLVPATLGALLGGLVAGPLTYWVGRALGPGAVRTEGVADYTEVPAPLSLRGLGEAEFFPKPDAPLLVWAAAALLGLVLALAVHGLLEAFGNQRPAAGLWPQRPVRDGDATESGALPEPGVPAPTPGPAPHPTPHRDRP